MDERQYYEVVLNTTGARKINGISVNNGVYSVAEVLGFDKYMENLEVEEDKDSNLYIVGTLKDGFNEEDVRSLDGVHDVQPYNY